MSLTSRKYWDSVVAKWSATRQQELWRQHSDVVNGQLLRRWLPEDRVARLLKTDLFDEAVSNGLYSLLAKHADHFLGIDLSPGIVAAVKLRVPGLTLCAADVRDLPFGDASFDVIVSISTLDHFDSVREIQTALQELSRVLRPGGQLLITLDNLSHPVVWLRNILPQRLLLGLRLVPYRAGTTCGPRTLETYCRDAGLEVLRMTAILHCPRALAVACAYLLERFTTRRTQSRYLNALLSFERLEACPSRFRTGHYTAILATKRPGQTGSNACSRSTLKSAAIQETLTNPNKLRSKTLNKLTCRE